MKKFIIITSALALAGGISYAMEEEAMDEEMMMEAPAPSVTLSGSAEIGIKNVDDSSKPNAETFQLIREYKVTFGSSGTTDGGLLFGAEININDTEDNDPHQSVGGASVYVGSGDGSWKVQFGGNDPGIEQAGGIGVADDHFGGGEDATIGLEGSFGGATVRMTMSNPGNSVPAKAFTWDGSYFGSGADHSLFYSGTTRTETNGITPTKTGTFEAPANAEAVKKILDATNLDHKHEMTLKRIAAACNVIYTDGNLGADGKKGGTGENTDQDPNMVINPHGNEANEDSYTEGNTYHRCSDQHLDRSDSVTVTNNLADYDAAMAKEDNWSVGFSYALDTISVGVGMDSSKGIALSLGTDLSGVNVTAFYGKSEHEDVVLYRAASNPIVRKQNRAETTTKAFPDTDAVDFINRYDGYTVDGSKSVVDIMGTRENTGIGVSASMAAGEGATFSVAYSSNKLEQSAAAAANSAYNATAETKLVEVDFEYALGGGATLKAGIDKKDVEAIGTGAMAGNIVSSDVTTLSASIAMSF